MKKIISLQILLFLFALQFVSSCRKETTKTTESSDEAEQLLSSANKSDKDQNCRLTKYELYDAVNDFSQIEYFTYKNGLASEWLTSYGTLYKLEYGKNKKLKIARAYDGSTLINTIHFIYKKDKVIKEIWYDGNTNTVADEVNYIFNHKDQMIYNESINFHYYVTYTYHENGNLKSWFYYQDGLPNSKGEYTYRNEFKNPYNARPGIDYTFAYVNAAFATGKNWYSGEKLTVYDAQGTPSFLYDQDAKKTSWVVGRKNYPLQSNYIDKLTGGTITNAFEYENCSGHNEDCRTEILSQKAGLNKKSTPARIFKPLINSREKN